MDQLFSSLEKLADPVDGPGTATRTASRTLYDPRFEHDSCGVGFVATTTGRAEHSILQQALTALARLAHRGAVASDGASSDGVGVMTAIPRALLLDAAGVKLADAEALGVGMVFIPPGEKRFEPALEACLRAQGMHVLAWRDVPIRVEVLGEIARGTMPGIRQVLVRDAQPGRGAMERRLYLARKAFERQAAAGDVNGYVCSLSTETLVYKAHVPGIVAGGVLSGPAIAGVPDAVCDFSPAVCDEYAAGVAPGAADPEAGA